MRHKVRVLMGEMSRILKGHCFLCLCKIADWCGIRCVYCMGRCQGFIMGSDFGVFVGLPIGAA